MISYGDPHQGFTTIESTASDDANGRMKVDFRDIFRGFFTIKAVISVDGRYEVKTVLRWKVKP